jgi:hypothetical protein
MEVVLLLLLLLVDRWWWWWLMVVGLCRIEGLWGERLELIVRRLYEQRLMLLRIRLLVRLLKRMMLLMLQKTFVKSRVSVA